MKSQNLHFIFLVEKEQSMRHELKYTHHFPENHK